MSDEKKMLAAHLKVEEICAFLKENNTQFTVHENYPITVEFSVRSQDIPINLRFIVWAHEEQISMFSVLPINITEDKCFEMAVAVNHVNTLLRDGFFLFNFERRVLAFKLNCGYNNTRIGKNVYKYMVDTARDHIDFYNEKFFRLTKDSMSLREFLLSDNM